MGINGLWHVLGRGEVSRISLCDLIAKLYEKRKSERGGLVPIGIDASIWLVTATTSAGHRQDGPEGTTSPQVFTPAQRRAALEVLFRHAVALLALPCLPIFVFDGRGRPSRKRYRSISGRALLLETTFQYLLRGLGFVCWEAPGEAEADLAKLCEEGAVELVITDDSDTFIFGSACVLRNPPREAFVRARDPADVPRNFYNHTCQLEPCHRLFVALCAGGDYNPTGVWPSDFAGDHRNHPLMAEAAAKIAEAPASPPGPRRRTLAHLIDGQLRTAAAESGPLVHAHFASLRLAVDARLQSAAAAVLPQSPALVLDWSRFFDAAHAKLYAYPVVTSHAAMLYNTCRWKRRSCALESVLAWARKYLGSTEATWHQHRRAIACGVFVSSLVVSGGLPGAASVQLVAEKTRGDLHFIALDVKALATAWGANDDVPAFVYGSVPSGLSDLVHAAMEDCQSNATAVTHLADHLAGFRSFRGQTSWDDTASLLQQTVGRPADSRPRQYQHQPRSSPSAKGRLRVATGQGPEPRSGFRQSTLNFVPRKRVSTSLRSSAKRPRIALASSPKAPPVAPNDPLVPPSTLGLRAPRPSIVIDSD